MPERLSAGFHFAIRLPLCRHEVVDILRSNYGLGQVECRIGPDINTVEIVGGYLYRNGTVGFGGLEGDSVNLAGLYQVHTNFRVSCGNNKYIIATGFFQSLGNTKTLCGIVRHSNSFIYCLVLGASKPGD